VAKIELRDATLDFPVFGHRSLRRHLFMRYAGGFIKEQDRRYHRTVIVRALEDINISLSDGDRLGLMGHNGAGKTTLLKVMARVYPPTSGSAVIEGRISPLFTTSPGMDPEDSGYENLATIGAFLGLSPEAVEEKKAEIEEFCELGEFLDLPVRTYSTGMATRLAFAICTCIEPEVLILDEGIGAGDARFANKVKVRVDNLLQKASLLVLASHSPDMIRQMCNQAALLERGRIVAQGDVDDVIDIYNEMTARALETSG
jgi:ABC-type polysaccharide/polyol phosphate transport system ATPase subunit